RSPARPGLCRAARDRPRGQHVRYRRGWFRPRSGDPEEDAQGTRRGRLIADRMQQLLPALAVATLFAGTLPGHAQSIADSFRGKQIRFVLAAAPGRDYDVWARFLARHLPRHVPGAPSFLVQNMPGAGQMLATNWLYNVAPRDGSVWGMVSRNIP